MNPLDYERRREAYRSHPAYVELAKEIAAVMAREGKNYFEVANRPEFIERRRNLDRIHGWSDEGESNPSA